MDLKLTEYKKKNNKISSSFKTASDSDNRIPSTQERSEQMPSNIQKRSHVVASILTISICLPLVLFVLLPVETFLISRNEFVCNWLDVVVAGLPLFGLFFAVFASALLIFCRVSERAMAFCTSFLVMLTFMFILEAGPLSYGLPVLDGNLSGYAFGWRLLLDGFIWITMLGLVLRFTNKVFDWTILMCIGFVLSCLISIVNLQLSDQSLKLTPAEAQLTPAEVMSVAGFNQDNNVLLLSMDMMHLRTIQKMLGEDSSIRSRLTGFTNFTNNITQHASTQLSVPSILHGQLFDGVNFWEHKDKVYTSEDSLINRFIDRKFSIFMQMGANLSFTNEHLMTEKHTRKEVRLYALGTVPLHIQDLTIFRTLPFGLKSNYLQIARAYESTSDSEYISKNEKHFYGLLSEKTNNNLSLPTFHAYHTPGAHYPFYMDENGQRLKETPRWDNVPAYEAQLKGVFTTVVDFLDLLKKRGLYDNSTIILTSDHGYEYIPNEENYGIPGRWTPMLMVKPRRATTPYTESDAPMTSGLIPLLISKLDQDSDPEKYLTQFIETLPKERIARSIGDGVYTDYYFDEKGKYTTKEKPIQEVEITKLEVWSMGKTYSLSAHSSAEPAPTFYTNGIDRNGGVGFTIQNQKDGEVRLLAPSGSDFLDLSLGMYSTVTGQLIITDQISGEKQIVQLVGGRKDFQILAGQIDSIRVPNDGIVNLLFEVRGKGGYLAFRDWTFTPSGNTPSVIK